MTMAQLTHPLAAIPSDKRTRVFVPLLIATLIITFLFRFIGPAQPTIVDFELAGSVDKAAQIINAWNEFDQIRAGFSLGFDYLYMPVYSTTIALACVMAAGVLKRQAWHSIGILLAWGLWIAAIFDAIENLALFTVLLGNNVAPYPQIAQICATIKFGLIVLGLLYVVGGVILRLVKK
jgi:hypothetical protein